MQPPASPCCSALFGSGLAKFDWRISDPGPTSELGQMERRRSEFRQAPNRCTFVIHCNLIYIHIIYHIYVTIYNIIWLNISVLSQFRALSFFIYILHENRHMTLPAGLQGNNYALQSCVYSSEYCLVGGCFGILRAKDMLIISLRAS